jgi:membrane protein implicated in regulation of membrane protease activity
VVLLVAILLVVFLPVSDTWTAVIIIAGCLLEIVEIVLLRKWSKHLDRRLRPPTGSEAMIGKRAQVVEPCRPTGTVHVRGELWAARCEGGADTGDTVEVKSIDGLTLIVGAAHR